MHLLGESVRGLRQELATIAWGPRSIAIDVHSPDWFERTNFGGIGDGNMSFRRAALLSIRGFDERIGRGAAINSGEEHYAFFRLVEAGFVVAYSPEAFVFHEPALVTRIKRRERLAEAVAYAAFVALRHPRLAPRVARFFITSLAGRGKSAKPAWTRPVEPLGVTDLASASVSAIRAFARHFRWPAQH